MAPFSGIIQPVSEFVFARLTNKFGFLCLEDTLQRACELLGNTNLKQPDEREFDGLKAEVSLEKGCFLLCNCRHGAAPQADKYTGEVLVHH